MALRQAIDDADLMTDDDFVKEVEKIVVNGTDENGDLGDLLKAMNENRILSWEEAERILQDAHVGPVKSSLPEQTRPTEPDNDTDVEKCIQRLQNNDPTLKMICLNNMKRTPIPQIRRLIEALAYNEHCEKLELANMGLYDNDLIVLCTVIEMNGSLKKLNLETNYLSGEFFSKLFQSALTNMSLEEVKAVNQGLSFATSAEREMIDAIVNNTNLTKVSINLRLPEGRHKIENTTLRNGEIRRVKRREAALKARYEAEELAKNPVPHLPKEVPKAPKLPPKEPFKANTTEPQKPSESTEKPKRTWQPPKQAVPEPEKVAEEVKKPAKTWKRPEPPPPQPKPDFKTGKVWKPNTRVEPPKPEKVEASKPVESPKTDVPKVPLKPKPETAELPPAVPPKPKRPPTLPKTANPTTASTANTPKETEAIKDGPAKGAEEKPRRRVSIHAAEKLQALARRTSICDTNTPTPVIVVTAPDNPKKKKMVKKVVKKVVKKKPAENGVSEDIPNTTEIQKVEIKAAAKTDESTNQDAPKRLTMKKKVERKREDESAWPDERENRQKESETVKDEREKAVTDMAKDYRRPLRRPMLLS